MEPGKAPCKTCFLQAFYHTLYFTAELSSLCFVTFDTQTLHFKSEQAPPLSARLNTESSTFLVLGSARDAMLFFLNLIIEPVVNAAALVVPNI